MKIEADRLTETEAGAETEAIISHAHHAYIPSMFSFPVIYPPHLPQHREW